MAAVFRSPAILFCQNNGWAISVPTTSQTAGEIWKRAEGYGFPGVRVDGNDVLAVYRVTKDAVARAHAGDGPTLIEALTYRVGPHTTADDAGRYRDDDEVRAMASARPDRAIPHVAARQRARRRGVRRGVRRRGRGARSTRIRADVIATEPPPGRVDVRLDVRRSAGAVPARARGGARRCLRSRCRRALNAALRDALAEDPRVLVYGQDVGRLGGVFRVTDGLQQEFGADRVFDTPIAEAGMVGAAVGLALAGWKAVVEIQFDGFSYPALDQVVSHVAKYRERTRGRVEMPITIRIPSFGGIRGKEHHGESTETYWVHTAGLKVVVPSTALDAYRLLRLAIADPDPVIVLEPKARYWSKEEGELTVDGPGIGVGRVLRDGDACTVVTYGAMVTRCLEAADVLAGEGIAARVVDLRSLSPLDVPLLGSCARETGRVVVVHEAPLTLGMGAEIAARVMEEAFDHLEAPVARVTGWDVPYPPASLEQHYLPSVERIAEAVRRTVKY